ncbi:MAG TPA: carboxylating nicotinate-nucleotide diphosphorylase [Candidatus Limnocylindrales bacterium]|nr:carboxylating nicotinate-nucleotide diphosphorylase [Candidatus Limnocylindrales bacterium]
MARSQIPHDGLVTASASSRENRLTAGLFHGAKLTLENPDYVRMLHAFTDALQSADSKPCDLTCAALGIRRRHAQASIIANEPGIMAGLAEGVYFFTHHGLKAKSLTADGQPIRAGQELLRLEGEAELLLSSERVGLNLLQRMCGIATATHRLAEAARKHSPHTHVVITRKTPWGLLDKRAAHLGGGGTHRLGLGDAILIKSNHLRLFAVQEAEAVPLALTKAWSERQKAAFIEIEVTGLEGALAAGRAFRDLRGSDAKSDSYPCLIMLDNGSPEEAARIIAALRAEGLWDNVLIEVSGGISEETLADYADCGVDAISIGALTHSCRALDLRSKLEIKAGDSARVVRKDT